jgi:hypothetical protein
MIVLVCRLLEGKKLDDAFSPNQREIQLSHLVIAFDFDETPSSEPFRWPSDEFAS